MHCRKQIALSALWSCAVFAAQPLSTAAGIRVRLRRINERATCEHLLDTRRSLSAGQFETIAQILLDEMHAEVLLISSSQLACWIKFAEDEDKPRHFS